MTLGEKQRMFPPLVAKLIQFAYDSGYELTFGDALRDSRVFGQMGEKKGYGQASSNHKIKLAIDLNLFKNGKYLDKTEDHAPLGAYWESLNPACRWGGRFQDGNHYSIIHEGRM